MELNENIDPVIDVTCKINKLKKRIGRYRQWRKNNRNSKNYDVAGDAILNFTQELGRLLLDKEILLSKMAENKHSN